MHDQQFMENYMYKEYESQSKLLEKALEEHKDYDEMLSRYCEFLECRVSHREWQRAGLPADFKWQTADDEESMRVIEAVGDSHYQEAYLRDWVIGDIDQYWDMLQDECQAEYLLKEHPPVAVWSHAYKEAIPYDEVWYLCPSCRREPQRIGDRNHGMYCGLCGGESCLDKHETMLDFFEKLNVQVFPFDARRRQQWEEHLKGYEEVPEEDRVSWYAEKLKTWKGGCT